MCYLVSLGFRVYVGFRGVSAGQAFLGRVSQNRGVFFRVPVIL